jgi:acyl dehydratase
VRRPTVRVGHAYEQHQGRVDGDAALAYALATNDPNDIYREGRAVPPLFTVALVHPAMAAAVQASVEPGAVVGQQGGVHAGHDVHFLGAVRPGMALRWQVTTHNARQTPAGTIVTQRILVTDWSGRPLVEHYWKSLLIGGTILEELGPALGDHAIAPSTRERLLGVQTFDVTADQTFRYAGASGDRVAHSIDDEAARLEGFPRKILQGLCTFAMCSGAVVRLGGAGDPSHLRRLAARFSAPMHPGQELAVHVYDAGATADGGRAVAFEARSNGSAVITHGLAELGPD